MRAKIAALRPAFDRRIKLEFRGARISSDGCLLAYRDLDYALGLADLATSMLGDNRRGRNVRHRLSVRTILARRLVDRMPAQLAGNHGESNEMKSY